MARQTDRIDFSEGEWSWTGGLGDWWCNLTHSSPMWPIHGKYECGICGRHYPVPWEEHTRIDASGQAAAVARV